MNDDITRIQNNINKLNTRIAKYERAIICFKKEILNQNKILFMLRLEQKNHPLDMSKVIAKSNGKVNK